MDNTGSDPFGVEILLGWTFYMLRPLRGRMPVGLRELQAQIPSGS